MGTARCFCRGDAGNGETAMNAWEKSLYNQIHPAKLATDIGSTAPGLYLLWQRDIVFALIVLFVPALIASFFIIRYVDLEKYKQSPLGRYVARYMTGAMQALRLLGLVIMMAGAWFHIVWLVPSGLLVVLLAWTRGLIIPN
jgi:hypothetical protein